MISKSFVLPCLALASLTSSTPTPRQPLHAYPGFVHPSNGICTDYTVKETITYPALQWVTQRFASNHDVVALLADLASKDGLDAPPFKNGTVNTTKTFEVAGTFCKPICEKNGKEKTVLVATHGLGFDRRYWASSYKPEQYSFAHHALNAGYSIFYYDRIGTGLSSRISGFENQLAPQVEILARIVQAIRSNRYSDDIKAEKVALVGHSYGSFIANSLVAEYPKLVDSAVLTGIAYPSPNDTAAHTLVFDLSIFASRIANSLPAPLRPQFAETLDNGYLGFGDMYAYVEAFLHKPDYEIAAAEYSFSVSQALAISEFAGGFPSPAATGFKGRVLVTSGQFDLLLCDGDCESTFEDGMQNDVFVDAEVVAYVQPGAGHGQNFAVNANELYAKITSFLDDELSTT